MQIRLEQMLQYMRPAGTHTEVEFIQKYIDSIEGIKTDFFGNRILEYPGSKVLITCHTDTVHRMPGLQKIEKKDNIIRLPKNTQSNCLGADNTAGIYAAIKMIRAGVPVSFVFHRAEECGGRGSSYFVQVFEEHIRKYDICLSLDRRGYTDIITKQMTTQTASIEFAESLANELQMGHAPSNNGVFTDSFNYSRVVKECSNLSVGYFNEHTSHEYLDKDYLEKLIKRLIKVNWNNLKVTRSLDDYDNYLELKYNEEYLRKYYLDEY
jgi:putative aminopeptidase FrvX